MEDLASVMIVKPEVEFSTVQREKAAEYFGKLNQVSILCLEKDCIRISYYSQLYSVMFLKNGLSDLGLKIKKPDRKPGFFKRFIDKLSRENRESFGTSEMDCCKLNRR